MSNEHYPGNKVSEIITYHTFHQDKPTTYEYGLLKLQIGKRKTNTKNKWQKHKIKTKKLKTRVKPVVIIPIRPVATKIATKHLTFDRDKTF